MQQPVEPGGLIDFDTLRSFVAVADCLAFGVAAGQLHISTPALTRRVQRLEAVLGVSLLERSTRSVRLTAAGLLFLPHAREALGAVAAGVVAVRAQERGRAGHLTIAALPTVTAHLLPRILRAFRARRPEIHLRVVECGAVEVMQQLEENEAEFGFTFRGINETALAFNPVLVDPYCLIMPPQHPLAANDQIAWRALKPHALITAGAMSGNMLLLTELLRGVDWMSDTTYEIEHLTTSIGMVEAGLGIAVVPLSSLPPPPHPEIAVRPLIEPEVARTLGLFWRRDEPLSPAAIDLLQAARNVARELRTETVTG